MTLNEIAETITPTGYTSAIIGLVLCLVVTILRSRARNLAEETAPQAGALDDSPGDVAESDDNPELEPAASVPDKPKAPFKAYVPGEAPPE